MVLRQRAEEALSNAADQELQEVMQQRYHSLPASQRPSRADVVSLIARFLDFASMRIEPRLAAIYLANHGWSFERAVQVWMHERYEDEPVPMPMEEGAYVEYEDPSEESDEEEGDSDGEEVSLSYFTFSSFAPIHICSPY